MVRLPRIPMIQKIMTAIHKRIIATRVIHVVCSYLTWKLSDSFSTFFLARAMTVMSMAKAMVARTAAITPTMTPIRADSLV